MSLLAAAARVEESKIGSRNVALLSIGSKAPVSQELNIVE